MTATPQSRIGRRYQRKAGFRELLRSANGSDLAQRINCQMINRATDDWTERNYGARPVSFTFRQLVEAGAGQRIPSHEQTKH